MLAVLVKCTVEKSNVLHSLQVAIASLPKQEPVQMVVVHSKPEEEAELSRAKILKLQLAGKMDNRLEEPKVLSQGHGA